jgi:hypothetical protein
VLIRPQSLVMRVSLSQGGGFLGGYGFGVGGYTAAGLGDVRGFKAGANRERYCAGSDSVLEKRGTYKSSQKGGRIAGSEGFSS